MRHAHGAAGLRPPERRDDPARRLAHQAQDPGLEVPGRHAGQPRRPGRLRSRPVDPRRSTCRTAPATRTTGSASTRAASARAFRRCSCDPHYFQGPRPEYVPCDAATREDLARPVEGVRAGVRGGRRRPAQPPDDDRRGQGHGQHPRRARRRRRSTTTASRTARTSAQVYATLFPNHVRRMVLDSNVDPRDVWYQANLNQDVAFERNIEDLVRLARQVRQRLPPRQDRPRRSRSSGTRSRTKLRAAPGRRRRRRRTSGPTSSCTPATTSSPGSTSATRSSAGSTTTTTTCCSSEYEGAEAHRRRQRLRGVQRGAVHRRAVAAELDASGAGRQLEDLREGAVRDLGQRLVQRAVPVLAGQGAHAGQRRRSQGPERPADRRDPRRGHAVPGQPRGSQAVPELEPDRRARRHDARRHALRQRLRRRPDRRLPARPASCRPASPATAPTLCATRCRSPTRPPRPVPRRRRPARPARR